MPFFQFSDRIEAMELPSVIDDAGKPLFTGLYSGPYFDARRLRANVSIQVGDSALLPCIVKQVGANSVCPVHFPIKMPLPF